MKKTGGKEEAQERKNERKPLTKNAKIIIIVFAVVVAVGIILLALQLTGNLVDDFRYSSFERFLFDTKFSFGRIVKTRDFVYGENPTSINFYPARYDYVFENDPAYQPTLQALADYFDDNGMVNCSVEDVVGGRMVIIEGQCQGGTPDEDSEYNSVGYVIETYKVKDYDVRLTITVQSPSKHQWLDSNKLDCYCVEIKSVIYVAGTTQKVVTFSTNLFLIKNEGTSTFATNINYAELAQVASYYQPIHKEILTKYIESGCIEKQLA